MYSSEIFDFPIMYWNLGYLNDPRQAFLCYIFPGGDTFCSSPGPNLAYSILVCVTMLL